MCDSYNILKNNIFKRLTFENTHLQIKNYGKI